MCVCLSSECVCTNIYNTVFVVIGIVMVYDFHCIMWVWFLCYLFFRQTCSCVQQSLVDLNMIILPLLYIKVGLIAKALKAVNKKRSLYKGAWKL